MSKFKIGDKVMLSPNSRWVNIGSYVDNSTNPLNIEGVIKQVHDFSSGKEYSVAWSNGKSNCAYSYNDLILISDEQPQQYECPYAVIEELQAHVETLEEALEKVTKELLELREKSEVQGEVDTKDTTEQFKPISEYTIEDWELALSEGWEFEMRNISGVVVTAIDNIGSYPIAFSDSCWRTLDGHEWSLDIDRSTTDNDIIKRIK